MLREVRIRVRAGVRIRARNRWLILDGTAPVTELQILDDARERAVRFHHLR